jgi:pimeloyl-ACP methyl ester carboxylesterase
MTVEGSGNEARIYEGPQVESDVVSITTTDGKVMDLFTTRVVPGAETTEVKSTKPRVNISGETLAAIRDLPSMEDVHRMVKGVAEDNRVEGITVPSEIRAELDDFRSRSQELGSEFNELAAEHKGLKDTGEASGSGVDAYKAKVADYNDRASRFQRGFEEKFLGETTPFYPPDITAPKGVEALTLPDGGELKVKIQDNRKGKPGPVFIFEAGKGSGGIAGGAALAEQMKDECCAFVTYDRRGTGTSSARKLENGKPCLQEVEEDFEALMKFLKKNHDIDPPVVLVTHSLGAMYAQDYVAKDKVEVEGLVFIDPPSGDDKGMLESSSDPAQGNRKELELPRTFISVNFGVDMPLSTPDFFREQLSYLSPDNQDKEWFNMSHQANFDNPEGTHFKETADKVKGALSDKGPQPFGEFKMYVTTKQDETGEILGPRGEVKSYDGVREGIAELSKNGQLVQINDKEHDHHRTSAAQVAQETLKPFLPGQ